MTRSKKPPNWHDWKWQLQNRITDIESLSEIINLSEEEELAIKSITSQIPIAITPYYASLLSKNNPDNPLRRTVMPSCKEFHISREESKDPLSEDDCSPVPGIVHRYPNRVLFLVTDFCSTYCRYCTRSRSTGKSDYIEDDTLGNFDVIGMRYNKWDRAIQYIKDTPEITDVLISGGDPLTLSTYSLNWILDQLRKIKHVEILRIGTKVPAVLPQRITERLIKVLKKYHPLYMSLHFTHPAELTPETAQACEKLADAGIPLGSQTVLLKGINDDLMTLKILFQGLQRIRVKPYYLYQCDPIRGSSHFRTPVSKGIEIMRSLIGYTSGYAVPKFVIDAPGGGGKIPLLPNYLKVWDGHFVELINYKGGIYRYPHGEFEK